MRGHDDVIGGEIRLLAARSGWLRAARARACPTVPIWRGYHIHVVTRGRSRGSEGARSGTVPTLKAGVVLQARELVCEGQPLISGVRVDADREDGRWDDSMIFLLHVSQRSEDSCIGNPLVEATATYKLSIRERPTPDGHRHIAMALYWCFCCLTGYHQKLTLYLTNSKSRTTPLRHPLIQ